VDGQKNALLPSKYNYCPKVQALLQRYDDLGKREVRFAECKREADKKSVSKSQANWSEMMMHVCHDDVGDNQKSRIEKELNQWTCSGSPCETRGLL
jgi:hypothetical protein